MSLFTCHPAHTLISYLLIAVGYGLSLVGLGDWTMVLVIPAFVMQLNGSFAIAYHAGRNEGRGFGRVVWSLAILAALIINTLFFLVGIWDGANDAQQVLAVAFVSVLASGQVSFLWKHRPISLPHSNLQAQ